MVLQGVISRASFRRQPRGGKSFFTVLSLRINNNCAQKRGIGKKLPLTIRAEMIEEHVDRVAGAFNGAAWRRPCGQPISIIEEAFADSDFTDATQPHTVVVPRCSTRRMGRRMWVFSSLQTLMEDGKYVSMVHSPFTTMLRASAQRTKAAIMRPSSKPSR